jgi:NAD(P)-dependent dehydrogenase (short-subunit alcohol dehydrogenase family)
MGAAFADPDMAAGVSADLPLRRVGQAAEVGATIATLLGDDTSYLTGQVIAVDGGATVR